MKSANYLHLQAKQLPGGVLVIPYEKQNKNIKPLFSK